MHYQILIHILKKRKDFYRYTPLIKEHTINKETKILIDSMDSFFKKDKSCKEIDFSVFIPWFKLHKIPSMSKEMHSIFDKFFDSLTSNIPTEKDKDNILEFFIEKDYATKIADFLIKITEGDDTKEFLEIENMIRDYKEETNKALDKNTEIFVSDDPEEILTNVMSQGLEWRLEELNISVGPIRKGNFVIISAPVNTGKTTALCSEVTHMASQLEDDNVVVWFNNEEEGSAVKSRIWQAVLGWTLRDCQASPLKTIEEVKKKWKGRVDRIKLVDLKDITVQQAEDILDTVKPGLIVFDQLWKVEGFNDSFSEVDKMRRLFGWGREMAHRYAPVITVHQADGTAIGNKYPDMHQLYNSRVGIQGEADVIIMIGRDLDPAEPADARGIHVAKNKLPGGPRSDEKERHGKWDVTIDPTKARYKGLK